MNELKIGDAVWYAPAKYGPLFSAVVRSEPWDLCGTLCVRLEGLSDAYRAYTQRHRFHVPSAAVTHVFPRAAADARGRVEWGDVPEAVQAGMR